MATWHKQLALDLALRLPSTAADAHEVVRELCILVDWMHDRPPPEDEDWVRVKRWSADT
jgi:hypothetical protein